MQESSLERRLKNEVGRLGGMALKFTSGVTGVPDRLVLTPKGKAVFVEMKAPGGRLRPLQAKRKQQLEALGFEIYVIDSVEKIQSFLKEVFL
ncbi:VRR-NUC domain-containing protein [Halalkalibacterium halodurans]|uniref:VRR-NUC domain-containing protein n=1 Tax=Halalkalibacterium halodurans TaxID=86665 RepID=UPI002E1EC7F7|nr:VRR-NUC domain-containing protein [Halalkalibacterium halodurans]MED4082036.1 VRR-NUC domain-containing protein [Halalkalibacterium halodurans]MED4086619.1 VRR-NUC domain-containing protein [Halalkalibacterium halodurans]MED4104519.1 VRR-NUC domain-containing protein [Halalkalibacterium halodurans]MED4110121.1 VRR-NUC domain-containing protein [Halalkalibacterium halodurans]